MDDGTSKGSGDSRVDETIAAYWKAVESGQAVDRHDWTARHPDLAEELEAYFADFDQVDRFARPLRQVVAAAQVVTPQPGQDGTALPGGSRSLAWPPDTVETFGDY